MLPIPLCHTSSPPAASKATKLPLPSPVNTTPPAVAAVAAGGPFEHHARRPDAPGPENGRALDRDASRRIESRWS